MAAESEPSAPDPAGLTELACLLARRGGALALARQQSGLAVTTKSSPTDVVTDADRAVEELLRQELARRRPDDAVLGEEGGAAGTSRAPVRWLIDPIDGTVNYLLGLPQWSVSVAAECAGRTVAAAVFNPSSGAMFHATLGHGAFLDERRLAGPRLVPLAEAVVATGFGYDRDRRAEQGRIVGQLLGRVGNLRRLGSAALDLCALAAGWVDLYYEGPLGEWDMAAGLLIATEAGVRTSGLHGRAAGPHFVAGAHPDTAAEFFQVLTELGAG